MDVSGKNVVITGGARGIGSALAGRLIGMGARVTISDLDEDTVTARGRELGCAGVACDVASEADIARLLEGIRRDSGEIDIFVSNAGIIADQPGHAASATDAEWTKCWNIHVMAHVRAARILLPGMIARGAGYFVNVSSAAGLLNQIGDSAYSASKHAAVSFAESLAISHGRQGIGVSVVCPQYVATPLIGLSDRDAESHPGLLTADEVAQVIAEGVMEERFLILPHPEVGKYTQLRAADHGRWIQGMQKLQEKAEDIAGSSGAKAFYKLV